MAQDIEALAHRIGWLENNFKQYVAGNTYNGVALTITGDNGFVNIRSVLTPSKTIGDDNLLSLTICGSKNAGQGVTLTIPGITFKNISNYRQPLYCITDDSSVSYFFSGIATINGNTIIMRSNQSFSYCTVKADNLELESWPTWADVF